MGGSPPKGAPPDLALPGLRPGRGPEALRQGGLRPPSHPPELLELGRVAGCKFAVSAITNVTQDHLDFHGSMDAYLESKLRLFRDHMTGDGIAVINLDDASSQRSVDAAMQAGARVIGATRDASRTAEVKLLSAEVSLAGTRAAVELPRGRADIALPLLGDFNLENLLVSCGIAAALELPLDVIEKGIAACPQVPGRMEIVGAELSGVPTVIVDYAHTPDAVDKLLRAVRPLAHGRLITVFGCGGDRDRSKRPLMAEAVARWSDRVVATSDNPRTEDPEQILRDVEAGLTTLQEVGADDLDRREGSYLTSVDRRAAIARAIEIAQPNDTVVLAGKGHEDYQIIGREKLPFHRRGQHAGHGGYRRKSGFGAEFTVGNHQPRIRARQTGIVGERHLQVQAVVVD